MQFLRKSYVSFRRLSTSATLNGTNNSSGKCLRYAEFGEPTKVLQLTDCCYEEPGENEVLVKWLLSPVNPADINTIQGKYPSKPKLPAIGGNEGVGEVARVGSNVKNLCTGDRVVPNGNNMGTWTSYAAYTSDKLLKVPDNLGNVEACMLNVNPCTAYRMLNDFVKLKPGDTVIQNGGNSAVGQFVVQLCRIWKLKSVSVVRDRPDIDILKKKLERLGADVVLTEKEVRKTDVFKSNQLESPILALNCIGGQNAVDVLRHVAHGGTMVTYGGMSREPVTVPTSALIFKNITVKGFWMTAWTKKNADTQQRTEMIDDLGNMFKCKQLEAPEHKLVPLTKYNEAIERTLQLDGKTGIKYIIDLAV